MTVRDQASPLRSVNERLPQPGGGYSGQLKFSSPPAMRHSSLSRRRSTPWLVRVAVPALTVGVLLPIVAAADSPARDATRPVQAKPVPPGAIDPEASNFPYPFPVQFFAMTVERQEVRMAFMDVPPAVRANGRTVLLLHGKNFSGAYWEPTIRALSAEGFRVVVPDQIGFGKSTKPQAFQFSFQVLADTTRALLDSLHLDRLTMVGHSMGGMLATRFALMFPERVEKLVLVNPLGLEDWKTVVPYRPIDEAYAEELRATPETIRNYQRASYYAGNWEPAYEALIALQAGWTRHPDYPRIAWCAALTADMIFTQPVVYELPRIRVATLLIIGQRDRTATGRGWSPKEVAATLGDYPTLGRKAAAAIPGSKLVENRGRGALASGRGVRALSKCSAGVPSVRAEQLPKRTATLTRAA